MIRGASNRRRGRLLIAAGLGLGLGAGPWQHVAAQDGRASAAGVSRLVADTTPESRAPLGAERGAAGGPRTSDSAQANTPTPVIDRVTEAARQYALTGVARVVEEGAFVTFPYGHGQPTLTCAPLRACVIELEAGESVLSRIAGDTQRWEIELAPAGPDGRTPLVVVKPHDCGLTTNLVLATTAGRIYDLTLDSPSCARGGVNPHGVYVRHVRFYYPDATVHAWPVPAATAAPSEHPTPAARADAYNFSYRVRRFHRFPWTPLAVFDDGAHVYIKLPPRAAHREAPVLFALDDDGGKVLLNYNLTNETYVTDRVFRSAALVVGEGGAEQVLRIDNLRFDAPPTADGGGGSSVGHGLPR